MDTVRFHIQSNLASNRCGLRRLDHDLVLAGFHCDLIVDTLEYNRCNRSCDCTILRRCDLHILRTHNNFHQPSMLDIIHTGKFRSTETHLELVCHNARKNITLTDKVCNECIFRLIIYILRSSDLLHTSFGHDNDLVRHRKCLLLVVCYIDKGNAKSFMHTFQFKLHLLAHL